MIGTWTGPAERERERRDLSHMLVGYVPPDDERRFAPEVLDAELAFEHASAFLAVTTSRGW